MHYVHIVQQIINGTVSPKRCIFCKFVFYIQKYTIRQVLPYKPVDISYLKGTKREKLHAMHVKELIKTNYSEW